MFPTYIMEALPFSMFRSWAISTSLLKESTSLHNSARVIFPCHQEHQRCIDFLLHIFVMGAVGDEFPNCIFPPADEIAVFLEDALDIRLSRGEWGPGPGGLTRRGG